VKADRTARAAHVGVVGQGEIAKAEVVGDFGERLSQTLLGVDISDLTDKCPYSLEHAANRPQPACSKSTMLRLASFIREPRFRFSGESEAV
jgi:hypothetical protein